MLGSNQDDLDRVTGDIVIATDRMSTYPVLGMKNFNNDFILFKTMSHTFSRVEVQASLPNNLTHQKTSLPAFAPALG